MRHNIIIIFQSLEDEKNERTNENMYHTRVLYNNMHTVNHRRDGRVNTARASDNSSDADFAATSPARMA